MNDEDFYNNIHNYLKEWEDFKDLALTHKKLNQLQSNWNSLREDLKKYDLTYLHETGEHQLADAIEDILDKMNELEGVDNENNGIKH